MALRQFVRQLRERKIWRAAVAYPAAAFVFLEAIEFFVNNYALNTKLLTVGVILFIGALPVVLVWNWCHGQPGPQAFGKTEISSYVLLTGITLMTTGYYWTVTPNPATERTTQPDSIMENAIAVLPFRTSDDSSELDYLCDGIAESLINTLSSINELKVISRLSAFKLRDKIDTPREVGRRLSVGQMLSGQLERQGDNLVIRASLVDTRDGREIWGNRFVRPMTEILQLEEMITSDIANELRLKLPGSRTNVDTMAYRHYLQGRFLVHGTTSDEIDRGLDHLREATRLDPTYAPAYAAIADAMIIKAFFSASPPEEIVGEARTAARSAIALNPDSAEAHAALGSICMFFDFDWQGSETAFRQAIELGPSTSVAYYRYANLLTGLGRFGEATQMAERAVDIDPIALGALHANGLALLFAGHFEEVVTVLGSGVEVRPDWSWGYAKQGLAHALLGHESEALALAARVEGLTDGWGSAFLQGWLAWIYSVIGRDDLLQQVLDRIEQGIIDDRIEDPFGVAITYLAAGNVSKALDWAEETVRKRSPNALFWNVGSAPHLRLGPAEFREHSRFKSLLRELNLPPEGDH